jgi:signal peptidase II
MGDEKVEEGAETAPQEPDAGASASEEGSPKEPPPQEKPAERAPAPRPSYVFLAAVSIVTLGLDLASKAWAVKNLDKPFERVDLVRGYLGLMLAHNKGGAWGLLQNESEAVRRPFFVLISIIAIAFIVSLYRKIVPGQWALKWGLPLVLGGALGNLIDRIRYGHVIDFIDMYAGAGGFVDGLIQKFFGPMREYHWPTYNVADIAIVAGVVLMAVDMFMSRKKTDKKQSPAPKAEPEAKSP